MTTKWSRRRAASDQGIFIFCSMQYTFSSQGKFWALVSSKRQPNKRNYSHRQESNLGLRRETEREPVALPTEVQPYAETRETDGDCQGAQLWVYPLRSR